MQEKRRFVRLNIPLEVSYLIKRKGMRHKSVTKNISPNGIRFALNEELPKGTILDIQVQIPNKPEAISLKAKMIWTKKTMEQGKKAYDSGFEFVDIPEENKDVFLQYLCNLMYDQLKKFD